MYLTYTFQYGLRNAENNKKNPKEKNIDRYYMGNIDQKSFKLTQIMQKLMCSITQI